MLYEVITSQHELTNDTLVASNIADVELALLDNVQVYRNGYSVDQLDEIDKDCL